MNSARADLGWLILRVTVGLNLALFHGRAKVFEGGAAHLVDRVGSLGFPAPGLFAWCAALAEFGGGLMVAFGLGARYGASAVAFTMMVALYSHLHGGDPVAKMELAMTYLAAMVAVVLIGSGPYSLDRWIRLRWPIQKRSS